MMKDTVGRADPDPVRSPLGSWLLQLLPCRGVWGGAWGTGWDRQSTPRAIGQGLGTAKGSEKRAGRGDAEQKAGGGKTPSPTGRDSAAAIAAPQRQEGCSCRQLGRTLCTPVWAPI